MKFEQLLQKLNKPHLNIKRVFMIYRKYHEYREYHIKKLKLGTITFEIKQTLLGNFVLQENIEIKYIRQDNTQTDNLKIENRLKALAWKNDIYNILALIIVLIGLINFFYFQINFWYNTNLNFTNINNNDNNNFENIKNFIYNNSFSSLNDSSLFIKNTNIWLNDILYEICEYYQILN